MGTAPHNNIVPEPSGDSTDDVAADLLALMPRDLVFTPRFIGSSTERLNRHFKNFTTFELATRGMTAETHPMLPAFIERHASILCEFVFVAIAISYQFRIEDIETLNEGQRGLLRGDLWDQLKLQINAAKERFKNDIPEVAAMLIELQPIRQQALKD